MLYEGKLVNSKFSCGKLYNCMQQLDKLRKQARLYLLVYMIVNIMLNIRFTIELNSIMVNSKVNIDF